MSSNKTRTKETRLICLRCGNIQTIYRKKGQQRSFGHIKHLWCWKCKKRTKHYEFGNAEVEITNE